MWDPSGPELRMPSCAHTHSLSRCQKQACPPCSGGSAGARRGRAAIWDPSGPELRMPSCTHSLNSFKEFGALLDLKFGIQAVAKTGASCQAFDG